MHSHTEPGSEGAKPGKRLSDIVSHLAHLLPAQGPIGVFVHHNTLHAFQHLPFEEAVAQAGRIYGAEPYMSEEAYRQSLREGRIRPEDLETVLAREPDAPTGIEGLGRRRLRSRILENGAVGRTDERNLSWLLDDGVIDPSLYQAFRERLGQLAAPEPTPAARPRDGISALHDVDIDDAVNPLLIRLCGAFLDQGVAYWTMPHRDLGFYASSRTVLLQRGFVMPDALVGLRELLVALDSDAATAVLGLLSRLGVPEAEWERILEAELLALPGWAGMIRMLENQPHLAPHERLRCSLTDFLAVRLALTTKAVENVCGTADAWRASVPTAVDEAAMEAAQLAAAASALALPAASVRAMDQPRFECFRAEIAAFHSLERRRVFHLAYEHRHERQILIPLARHRRELGPIGAASRAAAQVFFCIDEREESIRRHLEELDPEIETFGAAGFFGVAMNYHGIDDARGVALCPIVVNPRHKVVERPVEADRQVLEARKNWRRLWASVAWNSWVSSRTLFRGWLSTTVLGVFSLFPMAAKLLAPRRFAKLSEWLNANFLPEPRTELTYMRPGEAGHQATGELTAGFSTAEKAECVASVLGPAGLRRGMARLVLVLGHGSTSLNNPHESAYDCGACGGRRGGPNARLFADIANHPDVRQGLRNRGILIPEDTWFIGGYHDTCTDAIEFFDVDRMPPEFELDLAHARSSLERARAASAHERTRRFEAAPWGSGAIDALQHVEERATHLAEPRPEYGHGSNAVCIVGRRAITRGLFLDRRSFLVSYDATVDPEGENLGRLLAAVIPVCAGINLEYYFSFVDNEYYGCGTKLPHNITGLIGVMNGYESDLRTGLAWQTVEIHEPVRLLFAVEAEPERLMSAVRGNPQVAEVVENRWIRLVSIDPQSGQVRVCRGGAWEVTEGEAAFDDELYYRAASSADWYARKRGHLPIARIGAWAVNR
ncbi:MAG: DUF2309 domain-containing protein [Bryobacteraceae bacterium]